MADSQIFISKLCIATNQVLERAWIPDWWVTSIESNKIINCHRVVEKCKKCQTVFNKQVVEIKKDFNVLDTYGLSPLLSPNEDALKMERVTNAIQHKI